MRLKEICRNVAIKQLGAVGSLVECMVETENFKKGCLYTVDHSGIGAGDYPWLRFMINGRVIGKSPLDFRKAIAH